MPRGAPMRAPPRRRGMRRGNGILPGTPYAAGGSGGLDHEGLAGTGTFVGIRGSRRKPARLLRARDRLGLTPQGYRIFYDRRGPNASETDQAAQALGVAVARAGDGRARDRQFFVLVRRAATATRDQRAGRRG